MKRYDGRGFEEKEDSVVCEHALTIVLDGEEFATLVCSPSDLEDLVCGFLASEGVIRNWRDIRSITINDNLGFAYVALERPNRLSKRYYAKRFIGSCCGKSRAFYFHNDAQTAKTVTSRMILTARECIYWMNRLQDASLDFQQTGGLHNAALCTREEMMAAFADIGRHNALDKIYGYVLKNECALGDKFIVFSGRISSEVLLKTAKIGVGILISKSAPSDLALRLADDLNITVVGFLRGNTMNVYTHPHRIDAQEN